MLIIKVVRLNHRRVHTVLAHQTGTQMSRSRVKIFDNTHNSSTHNMYLIRSWDPAIKYRTSSGLLCTRSAGMCIRVYYHYDISFCPHNRERSSLIRSSRVFAIIVHLKRTIVPNIVRYDRVDKCVRANRRRAVVRPCRDERAAAAAATAAAEAAAIDQSTSNGRRAGSLPADSLCVCSGPPRSIFLRFRRRRMHESAVHTTTAETARNGRLTVGSSYPIFTHK